MAIYYVRTDGNDSNTGLGTTTLLAWRTIGKALGATGISSGDTVYIAPGVYSSAITVNMTSATADTFIIGNATASLFTGISAGPIIVTNFDTTLTTTGFTGNILTATSKNYLSWQNINFKSGNTSTIRCTTSRNWSFTNCTFYSKAGLYPNEFTPPAAQPFNTTFTNCVFSGGVVQLQFAGTSNLSSQITDTSSFINCYFTGHTTFALVLIYTGGFSIRNCTIIGNGGGIYTSNNSTSFPTIVRNCLINTSGTDLTCVSGTNAIVEDYNRLLGIVARSNVAASSPSNTSVSGDMGLDLMDSVLNGIGMLQPYTPYALSPNRGFGVTSGSPVTDMYGITWTNATPDAGSATYRLTSSVGQYNPTERNASTITIAPGSTSQSIELYLGATGLTFATSGLAAYYVRNQSAPVAITLVTQTPTGAWTSGGFAEISSSLVPGVYRLDVPNAAFAAGASDVTIVVRGASGTNGAVLTVTLSSGGLTAAQTADAILNRKLDSSGDGTDTLNERTVRSALRAMRNKVSVGTGTMSVYKEDDSAVAWTGSLSNTADVTVDPA